MERPKQSIARERLVVVTVVVLLHWLGNLGSALLVGAFDDDGVYTVLGKSLATGRGYHSLYLVGAPVQVKFPPGLPWILAGLWRITGSVDGVQAAVRWLHPLVVGAAAAILWTLARKRWKLEWGPAALLVLLPLVLDATIQYTTIPLAEPWFLLGWALLLLTWDAAERTEGYRRCLLLALAGLSVAATMLVRSQGVVLLPAIILALFLRPRPAMDRVIALGAILVPLGLWHIYHHALIAAGPVASLPDEGTYGSWLAAAGTGFPAVVGRSVLANGRFYVDQLGASLTAFRPLGAGLMGLGLGGMVIAALLLLRRQPVLAISVLDSLALVLLWPFAQDRLLLWALPAGGLVLALGLQRRLDRSTPKLRLWVNVGCAVAIALVLLRQMDIRRDSIAAVAENRAPKLQGPSYELLINSRFIATASRWILANTPAESRIMIDRQAGIYLYTGRQTMPASPTESPFVPSVFSVPGKYLASHILRDSLNYLIVGVPEPGIMRDVETIEKRCPGVLAWGGVAPGDSRRIYRIMPDSSCLGRIAD
ncbi:MAG TPA: hypothetical protein VMV51_07580 [Gemmatimonadaceae bacterium]|nr:hypothetical protein [Gemmatimonadaceae bacterium]